MELKTTKYTLHYENGSIRRIKSGSTEIVRRIYSAVRDHNWGTIEPEILSENIEENKWGFQVKVRIKYQRHDINFEAGYTIRGEENRLVFEMKGKAKSTFKTNRIGFCVLHPINECAGKECAVIHPDGTTEKAIFPEMISAHQPIMNISGMMWEPAKGISAKLSFEGDIFEMEDQRNWTDASYKTYSRPLGLPFPFEIKNHNIIVQKVVLEIQGEQHTESNANTFSLSFDENRIYKIPEIGVGATSRNEPLEHTEAEFLKLKGVTGLAQKLNPSAQNKGLTPDENKQGVPFLCPDGTSSPFKHLRAEIRLFEDSWKYDLNRFKDEANKLSVPLFLVLCFSTDFNNECTAFISEASKYAFNFGHFLIVSRNHLPDKTIFNGVFAALKKNFPSTKIGAGVNAWFAELNRNRDIDEDAGFVCFAVCPQVHAFDNLSLTENLEAQKYVVESARELFPGKPLFVSPVTLKQRFNVVETSAEPATVAGELPSQVDVRQNSVFAAQWLLGSLKFLAQSGASLITYFETVGWRGFIQGNYKPPVPEKFDAKGGDIFPVLQSIKELAGFSDIIYSCSSHPLMFDGLVVKSDSETKLLLFNFSAKDIEIQINNITSESNSFLSEKNNRVKNNKVFLHAFDLITIIF